MNECKSKDKKKTKQKDAIIIKEKFDCLKKLMYCLKVTLKYLALR